MSHLSPPGFRRSRPSSPALAPALSRGQSRRASILEALANVSVGYLLATAANFWLLPLWGLRVSGTQAAEIGLLFTLISLLRSYALRRLFNLFH